MMNKRCRNRVLWIFVVVLIAGPLLAAEPTTKPAPGRIRLTISRKTTHILGPVKKDGTVDYVAYLNAKHSKGVTKANNAAIPLIEILGPDFLGKDTGENICKILNIEPPSKGKKYFTTVSDYIKKTLSNKDADAWEKRDDLEKAKTKPWKAKQYTVIAAWLKVNDGALNTTLIAMKRIDYYMPSSWDETLMSQAPDVISYRDMGNALVARAMLKFDSGDTRGAWADLMAVRHLARRIGSGYTLLERLVALDIENGACSAGRAMAGSGKLTGAQARAFLADMQRLGSLPDLIDTIDECERFFILNTVMRLARTTKRKGRVDLNETIKEASGDTYRKPSIVPPHMKSLEWDEVLLTINRWYDNFVSAAHQRTFKARANALATYDHHALEHQVRITMFRSFPPFLFMRFGDPAAQKKTEIMARRLVSRTIGGIMVSEFLRASSRVGVHRDRATVQGELSVVAMALATYRAEKKAYPDKLSQLSPGYLKKIPHDLFVDKPFIYKPFGYNRTYKGYLLYSVGENMKVDGVQEEEYDQNDDIVVRVE